VDLEYEKSLKLDYNPQIIKVSDSLICVATGQIVGEINFYGLGDF
jgi:hypothetical protein